MVTRKITHQNRQALSYFLRLRALLLALIFLVMGPIACGGGTSGTGDSGTTSLKGTVVAPNGASLPGVTVSIAETGDSAITDADGKFTVETKLPSSDITIFLESASSSASVTLEDVPTTDALVEVALQFSERDNTAKLTSVKVRPNKRKPNNNGGESDSKDKGDGVFGDDDSNGNNDNNNGGGGIFDEPEDDTKGSGDGEETDEPVVDDDPFSPPSDDLAPDPDGPECDTCSDNINPKPGGVFGKDDTKIGP